MTLKIHPSEIILAIENLRRRKESANIVPTHATRAELIKELKYSATDIDTVLDELESQGRIERGDTINDYYYTVK